MNFFDAELFNEVAKLLLDFTCHRCQELGRK